MGRLLSREYNFIYFLKYVSFLLGMYIFAFIELLFPHQGYVLGALCVLRMNEQLFVRGSVGLALQSGSIISLVLQSSHINYLFCFL